MAYRFKSDESVPDNVRRIVTEEVESATSLLDQKGSGQRDKAVHEARKSVKKVRGLLRLMEPELGKTFREENRRFRDIGRQLSQIRDAAAMLETFDHILEERKAALNGNGFAELRRGLKRDKEAIENELDVAKVVERASGTLRSTSPRLKNWPLKDDGFKSVGIGLKQVYKAGRRALAKVERKSNPAGFHELRKRVKEHWYHVRLLESTWTEVMKAHEASLKDLEKWLGNDHNLVVLRKKLDANPSEFGNPEETKLFLAIAQQYQSELRAKSISLGQRIYANKPKQFTREMSKLWDAWHSQPAPVEQSETVEKKTSAKAPAKSTGGNKVKSPAA